MEEKTKTGKRKNSHVLIYVGMILAGVAIILAIVFWLKGETKTYGNYPDPETNASLSCKTVGFSYPFFSYDNAKKRSTEMNAIFNGEELKTMTLVYTLDYDDASEVERSEASNHGTMNKHFYEDGLSADAFDSNYARLSDALKYTISADADKIYNGGGTKYFLLSEAGEPPYSINMVKKVYQKKGFKCEQK